MTRLLSLLLIASPLVATKKSMNITLPDAAVLSNRFAAINKSFAATPMISSKIAEANTYPYGVVLSINACCRAYLAELKKNGAPETQLTSTKSLLDKQRSLFIEACLREHKEALQELETLGIYKPIKAML